MFKKALTVLTTTAIALTLLFSTAFTAQASHLVITGGKAGGTSIYYANAIAALAKKDGIRMLVNSSGGAVEQIRLVNSGKSSFSLAYGGQLFAAEKGELKGDPRKYTNIRAVASLFGAPAQLVVKADSDIKSCKDLVGKRVGVGNAGSGAASNAELFFTQVGVWDKMERNFLGSRQAADAFKNGQLDAFWLFVGFPNAAVIEAAMQNDIRLIDLDKDARECGLYEKYPYFSKVVIPAGTYQGVNTDVATFEDNTILIANKDVPEDVVYKILKRTFSKAGLEYMVNSHKSAKAMNIENGGKELIAPPMHPGAIKFWKEVGVMK